MLGKKELIFGGIIFIFFIGLVLAIWNSYEVRIQPKQSLPVEPTTSIRIYPEITPAISKRCGIQQCHGLDITCGVAIPRACTTVYLVGDSCRQYAKCQIINGKCQLVKSDKFDSCKTCVEDCQKNSKNNQVNITDCEMRCINPSNIL